LLLNQHNGDDAPQNSSDWIIQMAYGIRKKAAIREFLSLLRWRGRGNLIEKF